MLSNQTHVQQNHSQAHHRQGREIHRIQSGCQIKRHHGHGTITFLIMAFAETLEDEWTALGLSKAQFARTENPPR